MSEKVGLLKLDISDGTVIHVPDTPEMVQIVIDYLKGRLDSGICEKPKVVVLDNNPLSIASYLEDHPEMAKKLDKGAD